MRTFFLILATLAIISCNQDLENARPLTLPEVEMELDSIRRVKEVQVTIDTIQADTLPKIKWERTYCWDLPIPKKKMSFVDYNRYKIKRDSTGKITTDSSITHKVEEQKILLDQVRNLITVVRINQKDTVINSHFIEYGEYASDSLRDHGINHYDYDPYSIFKVEYLYKLDHDKYLIRHIVDNVEFRRYMFSTWDLKGDTLVLNTIIPQAHSVGYHADFMFKFLDQINDSTYTCIINKTDGEVTEDDQSSPRHVIKYKFVWPSQFKPLD